MYPLPEKLINQKKKQSKKINSLNMKYLFLTLALMLTHFVVFGQEKNEENSLTEIEERITVDGEGPAADTTKITIKKKTVTIIKDEEGRKLKFGDVNKIVDEVQRELAEQRAAEEKQDDWDDEYDYEAKEKVDERDAVEIDFLGFDLGITNYFVDGTYGTDAAVPELALRDFRLGSHVALHFLGTRVSVIGKGAVSLKTAFTIDWSNYYYTTPVTLIEGEEGLEFGTAEQELRKNKLTTRYAQIPLMLNFNTAPGKDNNVSFSIGAFGGLLWSAHTKQVTEDDRLKTKRKGDYSLNPIRYGLTARLDFKWLDLYVNYNLSELFIEGEGPATNTFVAGINLINF